jgi:two-component system chemotaxis sensor kinase CheA
MRILDLGRFRTIVLAIAGFLAFIAAVLALNFQLADRFAADAASLRNLPPQSIAAPAQSELTRVQQGMVARAHTMKTVQVCGILGAAGVFIGILFYFFRHVRREELLASRARKETTDILHTVNEGLFLLGRDLKIGSERSQALSAIFHRDDFAGTSFDVLLKEMVPEKTLATALDYVGLLWGERVNEKLVKTINPLAEVEVHFQNAGGGYDTHFLEFDFTRVKSEGTLSHLLVTVNDVTKRVLLARELQESQEKSQAQMDLLLRILHIDPENLTSFLGDSEVSLKIINSILKEPAREEAAFRAKIDGIFRQVHAVKGEAATLGLKTVEERAEAFEESLNEFRTRPTLSGSDFLPLVVKLDDLFGHLTQMREMVTRLVDLRQAIGAQAAAAAAVEPVEQRVSAESAALLADAREEEHLSASTVLQHQEVSALKQALENLVQRLCSSQGKQVELRVSDLERVPEYYRRAVKDIAIQLVRNAVVHGIELPAERQAMKKPAGGTLTLEFADKGSAGFELVVQDDGRGLQLDKIKEVAVARGLLSSTQATEMDSRQTMALIFRPGFSTAEEVTSDAGRGAGMDLVRACVAELGGRIGMSSAAGRFAKFKVWLPASASVAAA